MFGLYSFSELPFASAVGNVFAASVVENALCLEANTATVDLACLVSESLVGSDTIQGAFAVNGAVQESLITDDSTASLLTFGASVNETVVGSEDATALVTFNGAVLEGISSSETVAGSVDFAVLIQELVSGADEVSAFAVFVGAIAEALEGADVTSSVLVFNALVQELLTAADELNTSISINGAVIESITVTDIETTQAAFNSSVVVTATLQDRPLAAAQFITSIQEGVVAAESFIGRLLWDTIDTSETSNWVPIETSAVTLRISIGGGFSGGSFASGPISGLGGATTIIDAPENWNAVDTAQPSDWTPVKTQT
jgi:hypothetical protein